MVIRTIARYSPAFMSQVNWLWQVPDARTRRWEEFPGKLPSADADRSAQSGSSVERERAELVEQLVIRPL
jgi:hypothetical protein